jgi:cytoskeletal protein RodZ
MHTVGELLKKARIEKNLAYEEIEGKLRIRKKFLIALEENAWNKLPSLPYIKGFIRNYSSFLGLKPDEMVAIFRRQFAAQEKAGLLPDGVTHPLDEPRFHITPTYSALFLTILFSCIFLGYLYFQYTSATAAPILSISKPLEGETIPSETVTISGKTDKDAVISINNQKIALSTSGEFYTTLNLPAGINTLVIESTNKNGKKSTTTRTIQVAPK